MIIKILLLVAQLAILGVVSSFVVPVPSPKAASTVAKFPITASQATRNDNAEYSGLTNVQGVDRRSMLSIAGAAVAAGSLFAPVANAEGKPKAVVMGGAGYVGSRVTASLYEQGFDVVSASRSSASDQAARVKGNVGKSIPAIYISIDATQDDLSEVMKGAAVVVSCVGIPPWEKKTAKAGNGVANVRIVEAAKAANVEKFVYVSVAREFSSGPGKFLFGEYFSGKAEAEAAVNRVYGSSAVFVKPGLIDGAPPGEIRPPGPPGLTALSPDSVAKAAVNGALGQLSGSADGYDAIMAASK